MGLMGHNQRLELMAVNSRSRYENGYVPYNTAFTSRPDLEQAIRVTLNRWSRLAWNSQAGNLDSGRKSPSCPGSFTMGASRRAAPPA